MDPPPPTRDEAVIAAPLSGPTVLVAHVGCPAASDLTRERAGVVLAAATAGRPLDPDRLAEAQFCSVWFVAQERRSMWLRPDDDLVRERATAARNHYEAAGAASSNPATRGSASYLAAVMDLVLDPYVGERRMLAFARQFPDSPHIQDAWLWIADREAAGCGGAW